MTVLTIRDVPDELNDRLKARAREEGQSVQQFLLRRLWRIAEESPLERRMQEFLDELPNVSIPRAQILAAIEESRRERDA